MRQFFSGHIQEIRQIVVAGGDDDFAAAVFFARSVRSLRDNGVLAVAALDAIHAFKEPDIQRIVLRRFSVILERLVPRRLLRGANERQIPDFQQLGSGEKHHVHRVMKQRVAQATLVDHQGPHARAARFDGASEAGGTRADADQIVCCHR